MAVSVEQLFESVPVALYECSVDGRVVSSNHAYTDIMGYSHEEILQMHVWDFLPAGSSRDALPGYLEWLAEHQPEPVPYVAHNQTKAGDPLVVEIRWDYLRDVDGAVRGFACALVDSSQQGWLQKSFTDVMDGLSASSGQEFLHAIAGQLARAMHVSTVLVGRVRSGLDGMRVDTLSVWAHGCLRDNVSYALEGTPCATLVESQACLYEEGLHEKFPQAPMLAELGVDSYVGAPLFGADGALLGVVAAMDEKPMAGHDGDHARALLELFAQRIAAEVERRESEENYRALFESMLDGFAVHEIIVDGEGHPVDYRFLNVNPAFERLTGLAADMVVGKTVREVMPGTEEAWIERFGKVALTGEPAQFQHFSRELGKHFEVSAFSLAPMRVACSFVDVTAIKAAAERERELLARLNRSERLEALGVLAGGVAHDLNNILGPIVALPELMREDLSLYGLDDAVRLPLTESLNVIESSARRAAAVVRDLVALSRRERVEAELMDANDVLKLMQASSWCDGIREAHPYVEVGFMRSDSGLPMHGDVDQLVRVIGNLLQNGAEAVSASGTVTVSACSKDLACGLEGYEAIPPGAYVVFEVKDSGGGIPQDVLQRIFDPFYTTKRKGERQGSGLGLSVVHGIVKDHKGYVDVVTEEGQGTCFSLYFSHA
jgi:PAS domain S-box-containing protein